VVSRHRRVAVVMARVATMLLGLAGAGRVLADATDPAIADQRLEASYNASADFVHYPALDFYLAQVVRRLQAANPEAAAVGVRIHALHAALPYSFALDNGACYVSTGLLARLSDEHQLAALIAMPLAALVRHDRQNLGEAGRQSALRSLIPNLLLITATAGLGAPVIAKAEAKARADAQRKAQAASDAVAMKWLAIAGYAPKAAPAALRQLRELLAAEQRVGNTEFSDAALLTSRADSLDGALADAGKPPESVAPVDATSNFHRISVYYALALATEDITYHPVSVQPILDRIEANQGPSGASTFVRAEFMRHDSADAASVPATIQAYQYCIEHSDAPAAAYRELAILYRRAGEAVLARQNIELYLARAPNAADAPIMRSYLENP
jgi:beta-barrel assembly-enhancing protease